LEYAIVALCCGVSRIRSAIRRPNNNLEYALVSFLCGASKSAVRRPSNSMEHALVKCCCCAAKKQHAVRQPNNALKTEVDVIGFSQHADGVEKKAYQMCEGRQDMFVTVAGGEEQQTVVVMQTCGSTEMEVSGPQLHQPSIVIGREAS